VLISRPHNFERYAALARAHQPQASLVYLAEALFYRRMQRNLALLSDPAARALLTDEMLQSRETERGIPRVADAIVCVSDEEAAILAAVPASCPIEVIRPIERRVIPTTRAYHERNGLLFTPGWLAGSASPNVDALVWFATEVLPILRRADPDLRLRVTGADPPAAARSLSGAGVELLGFVGDLRPLYDRARLVVVPVRVGSGVKVKCLEAIQHGVPVVSTAVGAEGLSLRDPRAVVVADAADAFAGAVLGLYGSPDAWTRQRAHVLRVAEAWRARPERTWRDVLVANARKGVA
jgi:O-antigen biosynthesis protein